MSQEEKQQPTPSGTEEAHRNRRGRIEDLTRTESLDSKVSAPKESLETTITVNDPGSDAYRIHPDSKQRLINEAEWEGVDKHGKTVTMRLFQPLDESEEAPSRPRRGDFTYLNFPGKGTYRCIMDGMEFEDDLNEFPYCLVVDKDGKCIGCFKFIGWREGEGKDGTGEPVFEEVRLEK